MKKNIYFFQWISNLGGADTRLKELIQLFSETGKYNLFSVPNDKERLNEKENADFLKSHGVNILSWDELPEKDFGFAISFCNFRLFSEPWRVNKIKSMGLKFIWSNDMMWRTENEVEAFENKLIYASIYTSEQHYRDTSNEASKKFKEFIIPNYFHIDNYEYVEREEKSSFIIGKHSRPDYLKYSDNFPLFYINLKLNNPKYRVMGVDSHIRTHFNWFRFDKKWELLNPNEETVDKFLSSLDCYVYNCNYKFTETQCRATIEAMLSGLPVIAPLKFNFLAQILNGKNGLLWETYEQCVEYAKILENNPKLRIEMGKFGREISKTLWCDSNKHISMWEEIFNS